MLQTMQKWSPAKQITLEHRHRLDHPDQFERRTATGTLLETIWAPSVSVAAGLLMRYFHFSAYSLRSRRAKRFKRWWGTLPKRLRVLLDIPHHLIRYFVPCAKTSPDQTGDHWDSSLDGSTKADNYCRHHVGIHATFPKWKDRYIHSHYAFVWSCLHNYYAYLKRIV